LIKNTTFVLIRIQLFITFLFFSGVLLSGCSSSKVAIAKYQTNFSFSEVNYYALYGRNSDFSDFQNISDATRNSIELAIEQVLDKNGFNYIIENKADIIVTYHIVSDNTKELARYNQGVAYCSRCLRGGEAYKDKKPWKIIPGSLILDVIDPDSDRSVWRSVYYLQLNAEKDNSKETQLKIYQAIEAMMNQYPHSRGTSRANNA
jgi:hypothetical protein